MMFDKDTSVVKKSIKFKMAEMYDFIEPDVTGIVVDFGYVFGKKRTNQYGNKLG